MIGCCARLALMIVSSHVIGSQRAELGQQWLQHYLVVHVSDSDACATCSKTASEYLSFLNDPPKIASEYLSFLNDPPKIAYSEIAPEKLAVTLSKLLT